MTQKLYRTSICLYPRFTFLTTQLIHLQPPPHGTTCSYPLRFPVRQNKPTALRLARTSGSHHRPMASAVAGTLAPAREAQTLIPGLPDDLAAVILASLPFSHQARLRATSRSWNAFLAPRFLLPLRRRLHLPPRHLLCLFPEDPSLAPPYLFDPAAAAWAPLPPLPCSPHLYGLLNFVPVSLGPHLYVLGGSHFDARSYPLGQPTASAAAHRLDLTAPPSLLAWHRLPDMLCPRGSFACAPVPGSDDGGGGCIIVAGGGSRHPMFPSEGSRMSSVEWYDVDSGEWKIGEGLPRYRAGCVGFLVRRTEEEEFWVMGGYGDYRTVSGVVPADVYYRDAVVLGMRSGKWREVGEMWEEGERRKLGSVVVVDGEDGQAPGIFMLDRNDILRYDFAVNRWLKESSLRRKVPGDEPCGFIALNRELYVLTNATQIPERLPKKRPTLEIQVYNPDKRKWRFLTSNTPFHQPIHFKTAVACTIGL